MTEFNEKQFFFEVNFNDLVQKINNKNIILDDKTSFFLKDQKFNKIYRLYFAKFPLNEKGGKSDIFLIEEVENISNITISGTIEFK